jgi:phosphoribosyl-ATP pyrophosphohydrolase
MAVSAVLVDCDADCLIYLVAPKGPTCHTGKASCFFRQARVENGHVRLSDADVPASTLLGRLEAVLEARQAATATASYAKSLYEAGAAKIGEKLVEEASEFARAIEGESADRSPRRRRDVLFHVHGCASIPRRCLRERAAGAESSHGNERSRREAFAYLRRVISSGSSWDRESSSSRAIRVSPPICATS